MKENNNGKKKKRGDVDLVVLNYVKEKRREKISKEKIHINKKKKKDEEYDDE